MEFKEIVEEIDKHLNCTHQNWLFGAGISCESNIPLMYSLTKRVEKIVKDVEKDKKIYDLLKKDLPKDYHIEHLLSHLVDYMSICKRSAKKSVKLGEGTITEDSLKKLYDDIIAAIAVTVRYGYVDESETEKEQIGTLDKPIVKLEYHNKFIQALYGNRANMINRSEVNLFTTNYDTLLEDALAINKKSYVDGFSNGGIGTWCGFKELDPEKSNNSLLVCKLHGSVDWYNCKENGLLRVRYGTNYLNDMSSTLIYPQATKYVETQKDPFATLFSIFRHKLQSNCDNILVTCGYSFGDNHINNEIEIALNDLSSKTVLLAFVKESSDGKIAECLDKWLREDYGNRVFVMTDKMVYNAELKIAPAEEQKLNWWTFKGITKFLEDGEI